VKKFLKRQSNFLLLCLFLLSGCNLGGNIKGEPIKKETVNKNTQITNWGFDKLNIDKFHQAGFKGKGIKIAFLDTGVDLKNPDLRPFKAISVIKDESDPSDLNTHGTMSIGIVGAINNKIGIKGIAYESEIYSVKVFNKYGKGQAVDVIKGIDWCIKNDIDIINFSIVLKDDYPGVHEIIKKASSEGILMIGATGNHYDSHHQNKILYPAKYEEVISVGAIDKDGKKCFFTPNSNQIDVYAPGVSIATTFPNEKYAITEGTSIATPFVTGYSALLLAENNLLSNKDIKKIIIDEFSKLYNF
jgi:subtilisin family serine protease